MEDVLSVYTRPRDPDCPLVCLDETSKQLVAESRSPMAVRPGSPARVDYEYTRNGVAKASPFFAKCSPNLRILAILSATESRGARPHHRLPGRSRVAEGDGAHLNSKSGCRFR